MTLLFAYISYAEPPETARNTLQFLIRPLSSIYLLSLPHLVSILLFVRHEVNKTDEKHSPGLRDRNQSTTNDQPTIGRETIYYFNVPYVHRPCDKCRPHIHLIISHPGIHTLPLWLQAPN